MKPARFILNSDYTTTRRGSHKTVSVTIPDLITVPYWEGEHTIATATVALDNDTDMFTTYFSSDKYNYISLGDYGATVPDGSSTTSVVEGVNFRLTIVGNIATLKATCINGMMEEDVTFTGYGQTITAHIFTFKDPFSA